MGTSDSEYFWFFLPSKTASVEKYINFELVLLQIFVMSLVILTCSKLDNSWLVSQKSTLGNATVWITVSGFILFIYSEILFLSLIRSIFSNMLLDLLSEVLCNVTNISESFDA